MTGVVALRRRFPLGVALAVGVLLAGMGLTHDPPSVFGEYLTVLLAAYTVAERCAPLGAVGGGLALTGGVVGHDLASTTYGSASGVVSDLMIPLVIWAVGRIVYVQRGRADRSRRLLRRLETEREELTRVAVELERAHLARELHDVVTHSVSVVVIQAQGAQRVLDGEQPEVRQALESIESAGRGALGEMRRLLGLLREEEQRHAAAEQPGLADIDTLVRQVCGAGLAVELIEDGGRPDLEPSLALTMYRIVQEALTNALKYAATAHTIVRLRYEPERISVEVVDSGRRPRAAVRSVAADCSACGNASSRAAARWRRA